MSTEDEVAEILGAWQERREAGIWQDPEEVVAAHPALARELAARFLALRAVEQAYAESRFLRGETPERIGEYEIVGEVGRGGMGVVYEAVQTSMRRRVALKVFFPEGAASARAAERFQREARTAGRIQHTNIVPVFAMGREGGIWYYAMELVEGASLALVLTALRAARSAPEAREDAAPSSVPTAGTSAGGEARSAAASHAQALAASFGAPEGYFRRVAAAFADVADALAAAHAQGVIHRDVKPSNLILDQQGRLKLLDFGLARMAEEAEGMTLTGEVLGTPVYMSPEQAQARGTAIDHRTDVYSLGATLYEALTLRPPYAGGDFASIHRQIVTTDPVLPRHTNREVPRDLETIVLKAMEKQPARRYATAADLARDLRSFATGDAIAARRIGWWGRSWRRVRRHPLPAALGGLLLVAVVGVTLLALRARTEEERRRDAEYEVLLREAVGALASDHAMGHGVGGKAVRALGQAIRLRPDRVEAYVARALGGGRSAEERLADIAAARERGLLPITAARLEAVVLHASGRPREAAAREAEPGAAAERLPEPADLLDTFVAGSRAAQRGEPVAALAWLGRVVERAPADSLVAYLARRTRGPLLLQQGRLDEAVLDLAATRAQGNRGPATSAYLASAWRRLGQTAEAEALVDAVLKDELPDASACETFLLSCLELSEWAWARRAGRQGVLSWPAEGRLHALHAHVLALRRPYDPAEVLRHLDQGVTLSPDSGLVRALRALFLSVLGRGDEAGEDLARALQLDPNDPWVRLIEAGVLRAQGKLEEASSAAERAFALSRRVAPLRLQAILHGERGMAQEARACLDRAFGLQPDDPQTWLELGRLERSLGRRAEALRAFEAAAARAPDDGMCAYSVGVALQELGRHLEAVPHYRKALAQDPAWPEAAWNLANALAHGGEDAEALTAYEAVAARWPDRADVWSEIGACRWQLGDREGAAKAFDEQIRRTPEAWGARANKAVVLGELGRRREALAVWEELLADPAKSRPKPNDGQLADAWWNRGNTHARLGEAEGALAAWSRAAALVPTAPEPHMSRAALLDQLKRHEEAESAFRRAVEVAPGKANTHQNLAYFLMQRGRRAEARGVIERCLALDANHAVGLLILGQLQILDGEDEAAITTLRRAREADKDRREMFAFQLAMALLLGGRVAEAADTWSAAVAKFPAERRSAAWLALVLAAAPDPTVRAPERALELARAVVAADAHLTVAQVALALALHRTGRHAEALRAAGQAPAKPSPLLLVVEALARLGQGEESIARERHAQAMPALRPDARDAEQLVAHWLHAEFLERLAEPAAQPAR